MQHLTLIEKCHAIKEKFGNSKLSQSTFFNLYRSEEIKFISPFYEYLSKKRKPDRIKEQLKSFVEEIAKLRIENSLIVFIDETTYTFGCPESSRIEKKIQSFSSSQTEALLLL